MGFPNVFGKAPFKEKKSYSPLRQDFTVKQLFNYIITEDKKIKILTKFHAPKINKIFWS